VDRDRGLRDFIIERDLAFTATLMPMIFGKSVRMRIETTLDRRRGEALAELLPAHDFQFGCARNARIFQNTQLDIPLPNANPHAVRVCERQCEELLARRARRQGVAAGVRSALLRVGPQRHSLADLAAERHIDPRTLRRQLGAEGTSYQALADEVGRTLATELLTAAGLTVQQVADRLGYADAASLTRAFKRWTGTTPGAIAKAARAA